MRHFLTAAAICFGLAFTASASPYEALVDRFYDEDPTVKAEIEACVATSPDCAALKGEGLAYGVAGWPQDVSAAIEVLTAGAERGSVLSMVTLAYIHDDDVLPIYNLDTATYWYGRAAISAEDSIDRDMAMTDFLNLGFAQATKFADWKKVQLGEPRSRTWTGMGYALNDKPPVLDTAQAADLRRAQSAYTGKAISEYDIWVILSLAAEANPAAMKIYGEMLRDGYGFEQDAEQGEVFIRAAKTWE